MRTNVKKRYGFTLVELLVVIGIIALLISILLPTMNKARYQARKIACASNLRQFGMSLTMYAAQNKNYCPLFSWFGTPVLNNVVASQQTLLGGNKPIRGAMGDALIEANMVKDVKAFYCPMQFDSHWQYQTPDNPWPSVAFKFTLIDYGVRPMSNNVPNNSGGVYTGWRINTFTNDAAAGADANAGYPLAYPKITLLKPDQALATDVIPGSNSVNFFFSKAMGHFDKGMNVFWADNSVSWVPFEVYAKNYGDGKNTGGGGCHMLVPPKGSTLRTADPLCTGIFPDLDNYRRTNGG